MKANRLALLIFIVITIAACSASKKAAPPVALSSQDSMRTPAVAIASKAWNGVYAPGAEELAAIQVKYQDATLEQLKEGHAIYTQGACINCHGAMNIYKRDEVQWKNIIDDMAPKAHITAAQKDAVYRYVIAIKAVQPKETN